MTGWEAAAEIERLGGTTMRGSMELHSQIAAFRKQHRDILRFLDIWEHALHLAASHQMAARNDGLSRLGKLRGVLSIVREHCLEEEREVDLPLHVYLDTASIERLQREHNELNSMIRGYQEEARWAQPRQDCGPLVNIGRQILHHLRKHIAFEETLLERIERAEALEQDESLEFTGSSNSS